MLNAWISQNLICFLFLAFCCLLYLDETVEGMIPTSRRISLGLVRPTWVVSECGAPGLGSRVRGGSTGNILIEEPVKNSDDSELMATTTIVKVPT